MRRALVCFSVDIGNVGKTGYHQVPGRIVLPLAKVEP